MIIYGDGLKIQGLGGQNVKVMIDEVQLLEWMEI